jgi:hypothetical protein
MGVYSYKLFVVFDDPVAVSSYRLWDLLGMFVDRGYAQELYLAPMEGHCQRAGPVPQCPSVVLLRWLREEL